MFIYHTKLHNQGRLLASLIIVFMLLVVLPSSVLGVWGDEDDSINDDPVLKIDIVGKRPYYVQPVNVALTNIDKEDGLVKISIRVISNPADHQQVIDATFAPSAGVSAIRTRVRLAGSGRAVIEATAETGTGKVLSATGKIRHDRGVTFTNEESLTKRLPANVKGLKGPIGTSRARLARTGKHTRRVSAMIHHPMLPHIGDNEANLLTSMDIHYRDALIGQIGCGDAMSNDPYIDISFMDQKTDVGPIRIQWTDSTGNNYEPANISVKQ